MLISFDLATNTGIAFGDVSGKPSGRSESLGDMGVHHGARFSQALRMATNIIIELQPRWIAIEEPIAGGVKGDENRLKVLMGLRACIYGVAHMRKVPVYEYAVPTVRKHFIGQGNLTSAKAKDAVQRRCDRLGWRAANHNEADAMAVWDYARSRLARVASPTPNGLFDYAGPAGN